MGQYHKVANLDKKQFITPHKLGCGLKLWEQLASQISTGTALIVLLASGSNGQGGGDLRTDSDVIGSWRGDRIAFVGDYDDDSHYRVGAPEEGDVVLSGADIYGEPEGWVDVSDAVCHVIEQELDGKFTGDGWREFKYNADEEPAARAMKPDMVITRG